MNKSTTCPFCLPAVLEATFAESEHFRAIYNLAPVLPGHSLVIPKEHVSSFMDISDSYMTEMIVFSRKVIQTLQEAFNTKSYDWTIQEGVEAGQTVEHMHIHVIPRKTGDLPDPGDWYPKLTKSLPEMIDSFSRPKHKPEEMREITDRLRKIIQSKMAP